MRPAAPEFSRSLTIVKTAGGIGLTNWRVSADTYRVCIAEFTYTPYRSARIAIIARSRKIADPRSARIQNAGRMNGKFQPD